MNGEQTIKETKTMTRERFIEICERLGWWVHEVDGCCIELEKYSPEGEDFSFTIYVYDGREYWAEVLDAWGDFDPDERANMWYGQNRGEPASLRVLLDDAEAIKDMLEQLWRALLEEDEKASCTECGKVTPFTDEGGRCEEYDGWLCNECIAKLKAEGVELYFIDEDA